MSAKPDQSTEELSVSVIDYLEQKRAALIDELSSIQMSTTQDSQLPESPLIELACTGRFLSQRLAMAISSSVKTRTVASVIAQLHALQCVGSVRETAKVLVAYFLKYRFLDLSRVNLPPRTGAGYQPPMERQWSLPDGTETFWMDAPLALLGVESECINLIPSRITATPWMGELKPPEIIAATRWLTEMGFLEFALDADIQPDGAPSSQLPVLRIRPTFHLMDPGLIDIYASAIEAARKAEACRRGLVAARGIGVTAIGSMETYQLIANSSPNDILRISAYHLRTVVGERELANWIEEKQTLRVRIICLGPTSVDALTEGADPKSLTSSLARGIQGFRRVRQTLPRHLRKQISIRIYGETEDQSFFRGAILTGSRADASTPKRIIATVWPYGEFRANYGELIRVEGNSNLARLLVQYFDRAWEDSVPLPFYRNWDLLAWVGRSMKFETITALVIASAAGLVLTVWPNLSPGDALFELVSVVPILVVGAMRASIKAFRALRLLLAISRANE